MGLHFMVEGRVANLSKDGRAEINGAGSLHLSSSPAGIFINKSSKQTHGFLLKVHSFPLLPPRSSSAPQAVVSFISAYSCGPGG